MPTVIAGAVNAPMPFNARTEFGIGRNPSSAVKARPSGPMGFNTFTNPGSPPLKSSGLLGVAALMCQPVTSGPHAKLLTKLEPLVFSDEYQPTAGVFASPQSTNALASI